MNIRIFQKRQNGNQWHWLCAPSLCTLIWGKASFLRLVQAISISIKFFMQLYSIIRMDNENKWLTICIGKWFAKKMKQFIQLWESYKTGWPDYKRKPILITTKKMLSAFMKNGSKGISHCPEGYYNTSDNQITSVSSQVEGLLLPAHDFKSRKSITYILKWAGSLWPRNTSTMTIYWSSWNNQGNKELQLQRPLKSYCEKEFSVKSKWHICYWCYNFLPFQNG